MTNRLERTEVVLGILLSLVVVGLGLRFSVSAGALWRDEVSTLNLATRPTYGDVLAALEFDSAPALYPTFLRGWTATGFTDEDAAMRVLGFLLTAAGVGILWLGARALELRAPLLALALFAAQGVAVQTINVVKPYGLGSLLSVGAFYAIAALAVRPGAATFAAAMGLSLASVHTAYQNSALILAVASAAAVLTGRRDRRGAVLIAAVALGAVLSMVPYVPTLIRSLDYRPLTQMPIPPGMVIAAVVRAATGGSVWLGAIWVIVIALAVVAATREVRARRSVPAGSGPLRSLLAVLVATAAVASFVPFMMLAGRPAHPWHCVHVLGVAAASLDLGLSTTAALRWARVGLAVIGALLILPGAVERVGIRQTNVDRIAQHLAVVAQADDLIVVNPWWTGLTFARYYRGAARWTTLPPIEDHSLHRYDLFKARMVSSDPLASLHGEIVGTLKRGRQVWLIGGFNPFFVPRGESPPTLPPAPGGPSGWSELAYGYAWAMQTGHLVQTSAATWRLVTLADDGPVQPLESMGVIVVAGWRAGASGR